MGCFHTELPIRKKCVSFHTNTGDLRVKLDARVSHDSCPELSRTSMKAACDMVTGCLQGGTAVREPLGKT